jgi:thioesterase domain-containing protein
MYHTGDLARYLTDGRIECLGRMDDQVKIRGFRIEPGEIEAVLSEHPTVRQAVVLAREDVPGNRRLVAYVVPADTSFTDIERLRAFMRERLPQYMLPSAFVVLERLPLTPNGKIDRHALPAPPTKPAGAQAAPHDHVEATLGSLWAQALGVERVDLDDNFFERGGHSLLAASLFARQDRAFGRLLPLATIFEAPTIRGLARFYRGPVEPASSSSLVPITSGGSLPPLFALPGIGGNVLGYARLAQELGVEQPFYGLQSVGLDGLREPLEDIEEMAADCLAEIRQLQPRGPYHLLGACFGGVVAFEIAHQLIDAGESVAFLGLLNPSTIGSRAAGRRRLRLPRVLKRGLALGGFVLKRIRMYRSAMRGLGILEKVRFVRGKVQVLGQARDRALFRGNWREFYQHRVEAANFRALRCYKREPLKRPAGALEIFATDRFFTRPSRSMNVDWGPLASGLVVCHRVPGTDSGDMLREHNVGALAALLRERLARATRRREGRAPAATVRAR